MTPTEKYVLANKTSCLIYELMEAYGERAFEYSLLGDMLNGLDSIRYRLEGEIHDIV